MASNQVAQRLPAPPPPDEDRRLLAQASAAFATDLFAQLRRLPGNLAFSPLSLLAALAMAQAGARGATSGQMLRALRLDRLPDDRRHAAMEYLVTHLAPRAWTEGFQLSISNALWVKDGFPLQLDYAKLIENRYRATLNGLDFADSRATADAINRWMAAQTHDRIPTLVEASMFGSFPRLVLTNAVYLKADWISPFDPESTKVGPFHLVNGSTVDAPLMRQTCVQAPYADAGAYQVLHLDYQVPAKMVILLPRTIDHLPDLERMVSKPESLQEAIEPVTSLDVDLTLPKFTIESPLFLSEALCALGVTDAFGPHADFGGITHPDPLSLSEVVQKVSLAVDEEGTEAAAGTAGGLIGASGYARERKVFRADRPFLFLIQSTRTGAVMFMGRVANPNG